MNELNAKIAEAYEAFAKDATLQAENETKLQVHAPEKHR